MFGNYVGGLGRLAAAFRTGGRSAADACGGGHAAAVVVAVGAATNRNTLPTSSSSSSRTIKTIKSIRSSRSKRSISGTQSIRQRAVVAQLHRMQSRRHLSSSRRQPQPPTPPTVTDAEFAVLCETVGVRRDAPVAVALSGGMSTYASDTYTPMHHAHPAHLRAC